MIVLIDKNPYQGCRLGDVVRFESKQEGLAVIAAGHGTEVRWDDEKQTYVPVKRVSVNVTDRAGAASA